MAKKRSSIHDIQQALMANTQFIGGEREVSAEAEIAEADTDTPGSLDLDEERLAKLHLLARYQDTTPEALLALALDDFFDLRHRQLKAASELYGDE